MSFAGMQILSLESRRSAEIAELIRKQGGEPVLAPSMREAPLELNDGAFQFAERLVAAAGWPSAPSPPPSCAASMCRSQSPCPSPIPGANCSPPSAIVPSGVSRSRNTDAPTPSCWMACASAAPKSPPCASTSGTCPQTPNPCAQPPAAWPPANCKWRSSPLPFRSNTCGASPPRPESKPPCYRPCAPWWSLLLALPPAKPSKKPACTPTWNPPIQRWDSWCRKRPSAPKTSCAPKTGGILTPDFYLLSSGVQIPQGSYWAAELALFPIPSPRKSTNSRFTSSAWVQVMQCGPSFTTNQRAALISLALRSPEAPIGRIRSASP